MEMEGFRVFHSADRRRDSVPQDGKSPDKRRMSVREFYLLLREGEYFRAHLDEVSGRIRKVELLLFSSTLFFLLIVAGGAAYMTIGHGKIAVPDQYKWVIIMFYPGVFVSIVAIYRKLHRERFASEVKMNLVDIRLREHVKVTAASCAEEFESYCRGLAGRKDSAGKFTRMWNWNTVGKFTDRYASIIPGAFLSLVAWVTSIYFSLKWLNNLLYGSLAWKVLYVVGLLIVGSISVALFILGTFSTHYERDLLKMFSEKRREERDAALFDGKSSMVTS